MCLAFVLSQSAHSPWRARVLANLYKHVLRAWHILLVDLLLRTVVASASGMPQVLQITLLAMVVLVVDELELDNLSLMRDVRGYMVYRIAGELQSLGVLSMDGTSALGAAGCVLRAHGAERAQAALARHEQCRRDFLRRVHQRDSAERLAHG